MDFNYLNTQLTRPRTPISLTRGISAFNGYGEVTNWANNSTIRVNIPQNNTPRIESKQPYAQPDTNTSVNEDNASTVQGGYSIGMLNGKDISKLKNALGLRESSNNYKAKNRLGYIGKYQFGASALADVGLVKKGTKNKDLGNPSVWKNGLSRKSFMNNAKIQEQAMDKLLMKNYQYLGKKYRGSSKAELAGMLSASHLLGAGQARHHIGNDANGTGFKEYYNLGRSAILK